MLPQKANLPPRRPCPLFVHLDHPSEAERLQEAVYDILQREAWNRAEEALAAASQMRNQIIDGEIPQIVREQYQYLARQGVNALKAFVSDDEKTRPVAGQEGWQVTDEQVELVTVRIFCSGISMRSSILTHTGPTWPIPTTSSSRTWLRSIRRSLDMAGEYSRGRGTQHPCGGVPHSRARALQSP
jgi:hypothetical protein